MAQDRTNRFGDEGGDEPDSRAGEEDRRPDEGEDPWAPQIDPRLARLGRGDEEEEEEEEGSRVGRAAAIIALVLAPVAVYLLLTSGGGDYKVTAEFANAAQLTEGNEVVVGGVPTGTVEEIELGPHGHALVTFTVDDDIAPLRRGTLAVIRSYSLSGIANRQVQLTLPPDSQAGEEIPDGGVLSETETVSEVDLDEIFNTLDPDTIADLKRVIQGFALSYEGVGAQANRGLRYASPFLSTSRRVFSELTRDTRAFERLIVDTSSLSGALSERASDISLLIHNSNLALGALARQRVALALSIAKLPDFMRRANTTFVNLRAALDDVDPLVAASRPAARALGPFLSELRGAARDAVPTVRDLDQIVTRPGADNDLVELTRLQPTLARSALGSGSPDCGPNPASLASLQQPADDDFTQGAFGETVCSLRNGLPALAFFRGYTPELVSWFDGFGHSGYVDAIGGIGRIGTTFNTFTFSPPGVPNLLNPQNPLDVLQTDLDQRCPGAQHTPPPDGSAPFTDSGAYTDGVPGDCDPGDLLRFR